MQRYLASNRLRDIVADNSLLLPALSRFGISLGFGDSSVSSVCESHGVDTATFLAITNFISEKPFEAEKYLPSYDCIISKKRTCLLHRLHTPGYSPTPSRNYKSRKPVRCNHSYHTIL